MSIKLLRATRLGCMIGPRMDDIRAGIVLFHGLYFALIIYELFNLTGRPIK